MLAITNTAEQTVAAGGTVSLPTKLIKTGCRECFRTGSNSIKMRANGLYEIGFNANIGGTAAGAVQLQLELGGVPEAETLMITTTATAGDLENVSCKTFIVNCCGDFDRVTVVNTGTTSLTVGANPVLYVREVA